jgi:hypothetical protein
LANAVWVLVETVDLGDDVLALVDKVLDVVDEAEVPSELCVLVEILGLIVAVVDCDEAVMALDA